MLWKRRFGWSPVRVSQVQVRYVRIRQRIEADEQVGR